MQRALVLGGASCSGVSPRHAQTGRGRAGGAAGAPLPSAAALRPLHRRQRCAAGGSHDGASAGPSTSGSSSSSSSSSRSSSSGSSGCSPSPSRRWLLGCAAAAVAAAAGLGGAAPAPALAASADVGPLTAGGASLLSDQLADQLPGGAPGGAPELPRAYQQTVRQLAKALREAIESEAGGAKETEVRRKADPAKDLAKQFLKRWQDDPQVSFDASHDEVKSALQELGGFYQRNGPRSRLTPEAAAGILAHLDAVEAALPPEKKGLLGL